MPFKSLLPLPEEFKSLLPVLEEEQFKSLLPSTEEPIISFESPLLTQEELTPLQAPAIPREEIGLITGRQPELAFIRVTDKLPEALVDVAEISPGQQISLQLDESVKDFEAFIRGGPAEILRQKNFRQAELALSEEPITRSQQFRLDFLTKEVEALDPGRQVNAPTFIMDNFNAGLIGSKAIEPRLPPTLTGPAGIAFQVAGGVAHLSGFGVSLSQLNKWLSFPEFVPFASKTFPAGKAVASNTLAKIAKTLKNVNAEKTLRFLFRHKKFTKRALNAGFEFGARETFFGLPSEEDTQAERVFSAGGRIARETALGVGFVGAAKLIGKPLEKALSSKEARAFAAQATFGVLIGGAQTTAVSFEEDPWGAAQERLANAGMGGAAFAINHAVWRAFPTLGKRFFSWRQKARSRKLKEPEIDEGRKIFEELEELTLKSKVLQRNDLSKKTAEPPFFDEATGLGEPKVRAKENRTFVSPSSPVEKVITREEAIRSTTERDVPPVPLTPEGRAQRLTMLLESDPLTHPAGIVGFQKEIRALGDERAFKDVIMSVGFFTGQLAPIDIVALKTGTYKSMAKGLLQGADLATLETNDFISSIDRAFEILHIRKNAKTPIERAKVNQDAFLKSKDKNYNPNRESDPIVKDIMVGFKRFLKNVQKEENKLGYKYEPNELNYTPELAKTPEARRKIEEERIKFSTKRDVVSGEVFLPSALRKTGREGTIEDLQLQLKFRARAFAQVKNLSKPALEFSIKHSAMEPYLPPETNEQLKIMYNLLVSHTPNTTDRLTDTSINGFLNFIGKISPFKNLVERYGGPGVARRISRQSGSLQFQSFFFANPQFYIRNRGQITQVGALTGPEYMIQGMFKNVKDFPELQKILETDPEIAPFYLRTKAGEHAIDAPVSTKGIFKKGSNIVVASSHMSNVDGSAIAAYLQGLTKVAQGKWTPEQARQGIYWNTRLSQYAYDPARVPAIFRTAVGREAFRFKSWGINKIFYLQEHVHRIMTGHTGFGAPLDKREQVYSVMQILWELGAPSIKQGIKSVPALQILDQMRAINAIPTEAAKMGGVTISLAEDLAEIMKIDTDEKDRAKAIKRFTEKAILTWTPGGNSVIKKFKNLRIRGALKTFAIPPSTEDYKEWNAAQRAKKRRSVLFRTGRPQR